MIRDTKGLGLFITAILFACLIASPAQSQNISLNNDNLSFFEEPLAYDLGPATARVRVLVDQAAGYDIERKKDVYPTRANAQINLETELPNSWTVGAQYFGSYDDRKNGDSYSDNAAVFVQDEWGLISAGNVTGAVRENVRRTRGRGNADLQYDNFIGGLDSGGVFYSARSNAYELSLTTDLETGDEGGFTYSRPIGNSFYQWGLRARKGESGAGSLAGAGDTYGALAVASYTYSRNLYDAQIGYERIDADIGDDLDRIFGSVGYQRIFNRTSLSAEAHLGDLDGLMEYSAALGGRFDLSRGFSLNFGYNFAHAGPRRLHEALTSVRYEF